jgi:uncharacterized LabA/DUF88 family protein
LGELNDRGWKIENYHLKRTDGAGKVSITEDKLSPNIVQKGVDIKIGLDVASLSLKKQVDGIVLVAGDSDFIPPMKFARKEGVQLLLCSMGHRVKEEMYEHSDYSIEIEKKEKPKAIVKNRKQL